MNPEIPDMEMDANGLFREEVFSDQRIGSVRRLTPVTADGAEDPSRPTLFIGSAQLLTPAGPLPLNFEIQADSLSDAVKGFGPAAAQALEETMEELKEMRRQQSSSIVVPGMDPAAASKLQMP